MHENAPSTCLNQEDLTRFALGQVASSKKLDAMETHLGICGQCQGTLDEIMDSMHGNYNLQPPSLSVADSDDFVLESGCRLAVGDVMALRPDPTTVDRSLDDLDTHPVSGKAQEDPWEGRVIDSYRLIQSIGSGGMGVVYRASRHDSLDTADDDVAIKLIRPDRYSSSSAASRFSRELKLIDRVIHENVVTAIESGRFNDQPYLVMELLDGVTVGELLNFAGEIPVADALEITRQAACALSCINQHGMVHRDLKPSNLMVAFRQESMETGDRNATDLTAGVSDQNFDAADQTAVVKLLDLGLARLVEPSAAGSMTQESLTSTNSLMGTIDYMSPEQCLDVRDADIRSDLFSLGATLYRMLAGQSLWSDHVYETTGRKLQAILSAPIPRLVDVRPDLPAEVLAIVDQLLQRDPDQRFQTPEDLLDAIGPLAQPHQLKVLLTKACNAKLPLQRTICGNRPSENTSASESSKPATRRDALRTAVALVFAIGIAAFALYRWGRPQPTSKHPSADVVNADLDSDLNADLESKLANDLESGLDVPSIASRTPDPTSGGTAKSSDGSSSSDLDSDQVILVGDVLTSPDRQWSTPVNAGPIINNEASQSGFTISDDGLVATVVDDDQDVRVLLREDIEDDFQSFPVRDLPDALIAPAIDASGQSLLFSRRIGDTARLFEAPRRPNSALFEKPTLLPGLNRRIGNIWSGSLGDGGKTLLLLGNDPNDTNPNDAGSLNLYFAKGAKWDWSKLYRIASREKNLAKAPVILSADGSTFTVTRADGTAWLYHRESRKTPFGKPLPIEIPDVTSIHSACVINRGKSIAITTYLPGGFGQQDVWISHRVPREVAVARTLPTDLTRDLYAKLSFEETEQPIRDSSGNGTEIIDTLPQAELVRGSSIEGSQYGVAIRGRQDTIELTDRRRFASGKQFSVSFWIRGDEPAKNSSPRVVQQMRDGNGFFIKVTGADKQLPGQVLFQTSVGGKINRPTLSGVTVIDGQWHHVVAVFSEFSRRIYVDAQLQEITRTKAYEPATSNVQIGGDGEIDSVYELDEVCLYDRALELNDIKKLNRQVPITMGDDQWSTPTLMDLPVAPNWDIAATCPSFDQRTFILSQAEFEKVGRDLLEVRRTSVDNDWLPPIRLQLNGLQNEDILSPHLFDGGLQMMVSARSQGQPDSDLWLLQRENLESEWQTGVPLPAPVNTDANESGAWVSEDGLRIYFNSNRDGGFGKNDIWMSSRADIDSTIWLPPTNLGPTINSDWVDSSPTLTHDELTLVFNSSTLPNRGLMRSTRASTEAPWSPPVPFPSSINTPWIEKSPEISPDGKTLYYISNRGLSTGRRSVWVSRNLSEAKLIAK